MNFLMRLNESYNAIRGQILSVSVLPDTAQTNSSLYREKNIEAWALQYETTETLATIVQRDEIVALAIRYGKSSSYSKSNCIPEKSNLPYIANFDFEYKNKRKITNLNLRLQEQGRINFDFLFNFVWVQQWQSLANALC